MLIEVRVQSLGKDPAKHPVVLLREKGGERLLPIWIGHPEASIIALHLADQYLTRPLTHDLLLSVVGQLDGRLERVAITHVRNNTYYAELLIDLDGETIRVDARPSDAIALALRAKAPLFADDQLLDRIELEIEDPDDATDLTGPGADAPDASAGTDPGGGAGSIPTGGTGGTHGGRSLTPEELQRYLRSLNPEDFGRFNP